MVIIAILVFLSPALWYVISSFLAAITLLLSVRYIKTGNVQLAQSVSMISRHWIRQAQTSLFITELPFSVIGNEQAFHNQEVFQSFLTDSSDAIAASSSLLQQSQNITSTVFPALFSSSTDNRSVAVLLDSFRSSMPYIDDRLGLASAELELLLTQRSFPFSVSYIYPYAQQSLAELQDSRQKLHMLQGLLSLYTEIGGFSKKKTYLVLLQNSMELRPTGGFIGSIIEVSFEDGTINDFQVKDVYEVDGQLKGHIPPPEPIRDLLGQEHWYLRDSNWDPNFPDSGRKAAWFYAMETGTQVDGVIAISTPFIINVLKATGPIYLSDYNDTITADNFYGKSLYYTQQSFFPGSTQKKDFLGSLANELIATFNKKQQTNSVALVDAVGAALESHDIQFLFSEPQAEQLSALYGWGGGWLPKDLCMNGTIVNPRCYPDFLGVIDANLSINKVNYFIKKAQRTSVSFVDPETYTSETTVAYENQSTGKEGEGGGQYRDYQRIYIPENATDIRVSIDGKDIPFRNTADTGPQILPYTESTMSADFRTVGIAFDVPPKRTGSVQISYRRSVSPQVKSGEFLYDFLQPKQAGIPATDYSFAIRFPGSWTADIKGDRGGFLAKDGSVEYNSDLSRDQHIRIVFSRRG